MFDPAMEYFSDKSKPLGFGIIGTGAIARHHARSIQELDSTRLIGVCSSSDSRAAAASERFGVKAYTDVETFLANPDLDVVCVCTQSGHHLEPIRAAARAGKHILVEKPIEVTMERAREVIAICREAGVKLGVVFQSRFNPHYQKIKQAVVEGIFGKLLLGNAYIKWYRDPQYYSASQWRGTISGDGGAALINQGIHTIDLLLDLMQEVESVYGQVRTAVHDIEGEDVGIAILNFLSGALGVIEGGTALYPGYPERLEIYGEKGSVIFEGGEILHWNVKDAPGLNLSNHKGSSGSREPLNVDYRLHMAQIEDMVQAVRLDRKPAVTGEDGLKSLQVIKAIYEASEKSKRIDLN